MVEISDHVEADVKADVQDVDSYACKKCRLVLFKATDIIEHNIEERSGKKKFNAYHKS